MQKERWIRSNGCKTVNIEQTQLVGTSESAAAFNAKAPSQGVTKVMKDSGISTKDTTRVSNKFNGVQSSTGIANAAKSSAKLGGAFGGGMLRWNQS